MNFYPYHAVRFLASRTIRELVKSIDFKQVCQAFNNWICHYFDQEKMAIDGKSIKSTVASSQDSQQNFGSTVSFLVKMYLIRQVGILENKKTSEIEVVQLLFENFQINQAVFDSRLLYIVKKKPLN